MREQHKVYVFFLIFLDGLSVPLVYVFALFIYFFFPVLTESRTVFGFQKAHTTPTFQPDKAVVSFIT